MGSKEKIAAMKVYNQTRLVLYPLNRISFSNPVQVVKPVPLHEPTNALALQRTIWEKIKAWMRRHEIMIRDRNVFPNRPT